MGQGSVQIVYSIFKLFKATNLSFSVRKSTPKLWRNLLTHQLFNATYQGVFYIFIKVQSINFFQKIVIFWAFVWKILEKKKGK